MSTLVLGRTRERPLARMFNRTLTQQLQKAIDVWSALGCDVLKMAPEAHDAAFAAVSHLPHLIAFALICRSIPRISPLSFTRKVVP